MGLLGVELKLVRMGALLCIVRLPTEEGERARLNAGIVLLQPVPEPRVLVPGAVGGDFELPRDRSVLGAGARLCVLRQVLAGGRGDATLGMCAALQEGVARARVYRKPCLLVAGASL